MSKLRIAVIGAGNIAQNYHLPSLARLAAGGGPDGIIVERAALCDLDGARAAEAAARFGFERTFTDYRAMLDAVAPDAVWVLVPIPVMRQVAGSLLAQRIPILMEKPPGANTQETRELIEIAAAQGTPHQVAFNRRYAPLLRQMKALLTEAGRIDGLSCQFYRCARTEADFAYGTGLHGLDALRFLADSEVCEVHTRPGARSSALITMIHESGAESLMEMRPQVGIQSERYTGHAGDRTVIVDGSVGWLTLFPGFLQCYEQGKLTLSVDNAGAGLTTQQISGFYGESVAFISSLVAGRTPAPDLATALRSVEIAEAVNEGKTVRFG